MELDPYIFARKVFQAVDAADINAIQEYLDPDCCFRFANMPEVKGLSAFAEASAQMYQLLASISHEIKNVWMADSNHIICKAQVTYCRKDGFVLSCPAAAIWRLQDGKIKDYEVYVDNSEVFNPKSK